MSEIEFQLRNLLIEIFDTHVLNRLPTDYGGNIIFSDPIFGVSNGDDAIFHKFKEVVGLKHLTPLEMWEANGFAEKARNMRIVSIIFPYSNNIREASKNADKIPAGEYCIGRNQADRFIDVVLKERGMIRDDFNFSKWNVKKASIPGPLIKFSSCKGTIEKIGPEFGENNVEIYCDLLGYSLDDLKRWKRKKII